MWGAQRAHSRADRHPVIASADVLLADVTGTNGDVVYELGYADALGKPVVLLNQESRSRRLTSKGCGRSRTRCMSLTAWRPRWRGSSGTRRRRTDRATVRGAHLCHRCAAVRCSPPVALPHAPRNGVSSVAGTGCCSCRRARGRAAPVQCWCSSYSAGRRQACQGLRRRNAWDCPNGRAPRRATESAVPVTVCQ